jgi:hypothetical protein
MLHDWDLRPLRVTSFTVRNHLLTMVRGRGESEIEITGATKVVDTTAEVTSAYPGPTPP